MKKAGKIVALLLCVCCILGIFTLQAKAEEEDNISVTEMNQVMTVVADCEATEFPDSDSAGITSYSAGASVWVVGETDDGWYKVSYQGKEGYIRKEFVGGLQVETEDKKMVELNEAGLDAEMEAVEAEGKMVVEEVERQRGEAKRSRVWTIVIVALVIGIFVTGIISTVNSGKNKKKKK